MVERIYLHLNQIQSNSRSICENKRFCQIQ